MTLRCLSALRVAADCLQGSIAADIYLVDDGCTDNTRERVQTLFPQVRIIKGDGTLYWCQGMRKAWGVAAVHNYDAYLWLNDDVTLFPDSLQVLCDTLSLQYAACGQNGIIAGSTIDPESGNTSYGARLGLTTPPPGDEPRAIRLFNGNVVLVSRDAFKQLGTLSSLYRHSFGDLDYAIRAAKRGIPAWLAPGHQGQCAANSRKPWLNPSATLPQRLQALHSPTGCPPWELACIMWQAGAWWAPWTILKLYLSVFIKPQTQNPT